MSDCDLRRNGRAVLIAVGRLQESTQSRGVPVRFRRLTALLTSIHQAIGDDILSDASRAGRPRKDRLTVAYLTRRNRYLSQKLQSLESSRLATSQRENNRIGVHWLVQASLSDPGMSMRSVANWCSDFSIGVPPICKSSVGHIRDAFCETLKAMAADNLHAFTCTCTHWWIMIKHVHDEA